MEMQRQSGQSAITAWRIGLAGTTASGNRQAERNLHRRKMSSDFSNSQLSTEVQYIQYQYIVTNKTFAFIVSSKDGAEKFIQQGILQEINTFEE